ncbi:AhpC/TSA family protein [Pedobacter psychrodurus]|uniref:AhpC/TSA family protein n=1 Tax=Pedobacter psychrodurus TaxID=2530456 RepID=A0A4R0Q2X9_9SPHI|nr:TlpA disulfide reductase family protein [Pedobacter psychrodurus]TCD28713.1 AhpC/TSA family protein [Pedobacter psychrodurus]
MKYFIIILISLFALNVKGQQKNQSFSIYGNLKNLKNTKIYLEYADRKVIDSGKIDALGNFTLKGKISEPQVVYLTFKESRGKSYELFLENTDYAFKGDFNDAKNTEIKGGKEQALFNKYRILGNEMNKLMVDMQRPIHYNLKKKDSVGAYAYILATTEIWRDSLLSREVDFIKQFPSSGVSVHAMRSILAGNLPVKLQDSLMRLVEAFPVGKYPHAVKYREVIDLRLSVSIGAKAPDFSQPDVTGKEVPFSEFRGKYVLLDFWASWCAPCRAENPNVLKAYQKHKESNFTVLSVSIDVDRDKWLKAVEEDKLPWLQVSDLKKANAASKRYAVSAIPSNFLIDPDGRVIAINLKGEHLQNVLDEVLGKKSK